MRWLSARSPASSGRTEWFLHGAPGSPLGHVLTWKERSVPVLLLARSVRILRALPSLVPLLSFQDFCDLLTPHGSILPPPVYIAQEAFNRLSHTILRLDLLAEFGGTLPHR